MAKNGAKIKIDGDDDAEPAKASPAAKPKKSQEKKKKPKAKKKSKKAVRLSGFNPTDCKMTDFCSVECLFEAIGALYIIESRICHQGESG